MFVGRTAYDVYMKEPREIVEQDDGKFTVYSRLEQR